MSKEKKTRFEQVKKDGPEIVLNVMSNQPNESMYSLLAMFYKGAAENTIAFMEAKDTRTGKVAPILVGFELNKENRFDMYPLARVLDKEELQFYAAPDGRGNYIGDKQNSDV